MKEQMRFKDRRRELQRTIAKTIEYADGRWVAIPVRVFVGNRKAARA